MVTISNSEEVRKQMKKVMVYFQGDTASTLRNLFAYASAYLKEKRKPLLIFIDETDSDSRFPLPHIISGAMVVGLLSRAKSLAFRRDKVSGMTTDDILAATDLLFEENKGLALREFIEKMALPAETIKRYN